MEADKRRRQQTRVTLWRYPMAALKQISGLSLAWQVVRERSAPGIGESDAGSDAATVPVVGAQVCVNGMASIPCAITDSSGKFTLSGLPPTTNVAVTVNATGYRSAVLPISVGTTPMVGTTGPVSMLSAGDPDPSIGTTIDWTDKGQVVFFVLGPGALTPDSGPIGDPGAMVTLSPSSGVGPLFLTDQNTFAADAQALIDVGGAVYNVSPGSYTLAVNDPTGNCQPVLYPFPGWGYPGTAHEVAFPVLEGYVTVVGEYCTKNASGTPGDASASDAQSTVADAESGAD